MKLLEHKKFAAFAVAPLLAAAFAAAIVGFTQPTTAGAAGTTHDFAVGAVTPTNGSMAAGHVAFAAELIGTRTSGYVVEQSATSLNANGPVKCIGFEGANARVVWHVNHSNDTTQPAGTTRTSASWPNDSSIVGQSTPSLCWAGR